MIKMTDNVETRDGRAVELLRNDIKSKQLCIVGIITEKNGSETADVWMADGHYDINTHDKSDMDLVVSKPVAKNMPKKADSKAVAMKKTPKAPTTQAKAKIAATVTKQAKTGISQEPPDDEDDLEDLKDDAQEPLVFKTKKGDINLVGKSKRLPIVKHNGGKK